MPCTCKGNIIRHWIVFYIYQRQRRHARQLVINYGQTYFRHEAGTMIMHSIKAACVWEFIQIKGILIGTGRSLCCWGWNTRRTRSTPWLFQDLHSSTAVIKLQRGEISNHTTMIIAECGWIWALKTERDKNETRLQREAWPCSFLFSDMSAGSISLHEWGVVHVDA